MAELILVNAFEFETRVALLENGNISQVFIERARERSIVGNIYKGKVIRVLPGIQSAFIEIGLERTGFLYVSEILPTDSLFQFEDTEEFDLEESEGLSQTLPKAKLRGGKRQVQIQDLLRQGQEILVQVIREPIGDKGAQITTYLALPGRYLVYMPESPHIGVSRKIEDPRERQRLKKIVERLKKNFEGGFIVRTASRQVGENELAQELDYLIALWNELKHKAQHSPTPSLIYQEPTLELRVIREYLDAETKKILLDDEFRLEKIKEFLRRMEPGAEKLAELWRGKTPLFEHFGIEKELARALEKRVWLKSGGFIVLDETEALTTIDVNTGRFVGKKNFEETILKTNIEASKELVSQLRLRNIGGIIIIDFIDMNRSKHREKVLNALKEELKKDKAKSVVVRLSEIGLVEMTRKRSSGSLTKKLSSPCPYCQGKGYLKSPNSIAYEIFRELVKNKAELAGKSIKLYVNTLVAELLLGREKALLEMLEKAYQIKLEVVAKDNFHQEQYEYSVLEKTTRLHRPEAG